jgi:tetratricopeptide (TPR) repeat protein
MRAWGVAAFALAMLAADAAHASPLDDAVEDHRVANDPKATIAVRQEAQLSLAKRLYAMRLYQAAYAVFADIADKPEHLAFERTLPWLAKLETDLPRPAGVDERLSKYDERAIEAHHLEFYRGRWAFENHRYDEAIRWFAKVPREPRFYPRAWFLAGIANVQLKRAHDAVAAWKRVIAAMDESPAYDTEWNERMRDLAILSIARTYYSVKAYDVALQYWRGIDEVSEHWTDAFYEQSWALFMTGDHAKALGNLHILRLDSFATDWRPEADHLKALIYLANCQYEDARTLAARFEQYHRPILKELAALHFADDEAAYGFMRDVRDGKTSLSPATKHAAAAELSDRELLRHPQYVVLLDDEKKRLLRTPPSFRDSALGTDAKDAIDLARDIAIRNAGQLTRARLERTKSELDRLLGENMQILTAARPDVGVRMPAGTDKNVVHGDEEHVIWPFTGEIWPDEVGTYRQSISSKCR